MYYFAYGSNMSQRRLQQRLSGSTSLGYARLPGYDVVFHKRGSRDSSGKCGLVAAPGDTWAHGVVFTINDHHKPLLDDIEGVGDGYACHDVTVHHEQLGLLPCLTYLAEELDESLRLYPWYLEHVLVGAREHDLPADYIQHLQTLPTIDDPDSARHDRELAIYSAGD
ncbi:MAG: gamma-glutamylcyclotransferase family protein [Pseudohongiellaceae bacterium]